MMKLIRRTVKASVGLVVMFACAGIGFQVGRRTDLGLSGPQLRRITAFVRSALRRLHGWPTSRTLHGRTLRELNVIRGQNDRILSQNEHIYLQNDKILAILEASAAPAHARADTRAI